MKVAAQGALVRDPADIASRPEAKKKMKALKEAVKIINQKIEEKQQYDIQR